MTEQVDVRDLKSRGKSRAGSSPARRTKTQIVAHLRGKLGLSYSVIYERTGIKPKTAIVLYYNYRHPEKKKTYAKKYINEHRQKVYAQQKKWNRNNPERIKEYYYRRKCKEAGVTL